MNTLGNYITSENIGIELKSFHLTNISNISIEDITAIIKSGKWNDDFENIIENNLSDFIATVIPKYISCFNNAKIKGILYLGVDDSGEISGIPYSKTIPVELIKKSVYNSIKNHLKCNKFSNDKIIDNINIKIIPLETDINILTDSAQKFYDNYSKNVIKLNDYMEEYNIKRYMWLHRLGLYSQKLNLMLNTTKYRNELKQKIIDEDTENEATHLVELLASNECLILDYDNIHDETQRGNKKRLFYWIAKFRDDMINLIRKERPEKIMFNFKYFPRHILCNLPDLRYKFVENDIQYYMIKIDCNIENLEDEFLFKFPNSNKWQYRVRIQDDSGPKCI